MNRSATVVRTTKETEIKLVLSLDGGPSEINTGVGFFDHMLTLFSHHGGFGIKLTAKGDLYVDAHHTVEDVGIALGEAFYTAAGDKMGIARYGFFLLPMDETLTEVAVDFGGRAFLVYDVKYNYSGSDFDMALVEEFFRAFTSNAKMNLHINLRYGTNDHHKAEAVFKATARALKAAVKIDSKILPSTKGVIA